MDIKKDFFTLEYNKVKPEVGKLLISEPFGGDVFFRRSVVLIIEYNEEGTVGLILNKQVANKIDFFSKEFKEYQKNVFLGGPVSPGNLFFLHKFGDSIPGSVKIADNLYWGGSSEIIKILLSAGKLTDENFKFFVGYSGWQPKQLEEELEKNYWLVLDINNQNILDHKTDLWRNTIKQSGNKYKFWENFPNNPAYN